MKTATKRKASAIDVPQSDADADKCLMHYGMTSVELQRLQADLDAKLAAVKARHEALAKPLQDRLNTIFEQLSAWGAAHRDRLTDKGKSKTVQLPAGAIGWRQAPPSVTFRRGLKVEDIVALLKEAGFRRFIRVKEEPNKEAMLDKPELANTIDGVKVGSKGEEFFVAPFGADLAEPRR